MRVRITIFIACFLVAGIAVQAAEKLPQGKWTVEQVTIEKNTDGNLQTNVYNKVTEVKSYIPCMKELEIKAETLILRYSDGREEIMPLVLESNKLKIAAAGAIFLYGYILSENTLTMTVTHKYGYNTPEGQVENIEEKWTIVLNK